MDLIKGVDVSHWQGNIKWSAVKNAGYDYVFIKLTDGHNYTDPKGIENVRAALSAGLVVGGYHFARFKNVNEAVKEAAYFKSLAAGLGLTYAVLDIEDTKLPGDLTDASIAFLDAVSSIAQPILYSGPSYIRSHFNSKITKYPLWIAHYGVATPSVPLWPDWQIWQQRSNGTVPGISGNVDIDVMKADFLKTGGDNMINKLVIASGDGDWCTASLAAYKYRCPAILKDVFESNKTANQAKQYIVIGGPETYNPGPNTLHLTGADRIPTAIKALS